MKITIKEAIKSTGKSEPTIRRLLSKNESKSYIEHIDGKVLIDVNYLYSIYPPNKQKNKEKVLKNDTNDIYHNTINVDHHNTIDIQELKHKIELLEKDLQYQKVLNEEIKKNSNDRILDLQNALRLLEYKQKEELPKKKKWWNLF